MKLLYIRVQVLSWILMRSSERGQSKFRFDEEKTYC